MSLSSEYGLEVNHLTEAERDIILSVIRRDEDLRAKEAHRLDKLRYEIKQIRLRGCIRPGLDPAKTCARCRRPFGWLLNTGDLCPNCNHKVCSDCKNVSSLHKTWLCSLCYKQKELDRQSAMWFRSKVRKSKRNKKTNEMVTGPQLFRESIKRSNGRPRPQHKSRSVDNLKNESLEDLNDLNLSLDEEFEESSDTQSTQASPVRADHPQFNHNPTLGVEQKSIRDKPFVIDPAPTSLATYHAARLKDKAAQKSLLEREQRTSVDGHVYIAGSATTAMGFPRNSDEARLRELIGGPTKKAPKLYEIPPELDDSGSSSSGQSIPSSPQFSRNTDLSGISDSIRSSIRSTSAVSSDGRITIVTDNQSLSDIELYTTDRFISPEQYLEMKYSSHSGGKYSDRNANEIPLPVEDAGSIAHSLEMDVVDATTAVTLVPEIHRKNSNSPTISVATSDMSQLTNSSKKSVPALGPHTSTDQAKRQRQREEEEVARLKSEARANDGSIHSNTETEKKTKSQTSQISSVRTEESKTETKLTIEDNNNDKAKEISHMVSSESASSNHTVSVERNLEDVLEEAISEVDDDDIDKAFELHASTTSLNLPPPSTSQNLRKSLYMSQPNLAGPSTNLKGTYSQSRESLASFYSDAGEGNITVAIAGEIQVKIKRCRDLACVDIKRHRSDPYVKLYLLPDRSRTGKRKTKIKKHTLNPVYDESVRFAVSKGELESRNLWITVWHNDMFGRNVFLGEVSLPMDFHNFEDHTLKWYKLQDKNPNPVSRFTYKGDLLLSLKYVTVDQKSKGLATSSRGELLVIIKEAHNLTAVRANGTSDPFCKAYLLPDKTKHSKQKTKVVKKNCSPVWNETFVYDGLTIEELRNRSLEITIWDHDRFSSNDFLGGLRLNCGTGEHQHREVEWMDAKGEEVSTWQAMLDRPNTWIETSLLLRSSMDNRS